ncbi:hypothetical protein SAMN06264364_1065 [Quadrisphaera granulorum]|uniref:Uncharacterized protein n=1 Tax=Quadrisphaera granulorum TaxID=317664 RepID=A0A316AA64_9ACTN|nr:hypothetical protein [Quadrisphaera granulorum]PWJ54563.1 hypothetical protein BXY45_1065 [Quadrisphaera granulorum]SZE95925.1 hypothetical protein SAMN06264364_1065 [Quadrisphaera granulorum]
MTPRDRSSSFGHEDDDDGGRGAVDLDFVDDPDATEHDRALDAQLSRLVTDRLLAVELPPTRVDLEAAKRRVDAARPRARRRRAWVFTGAAAAAAAAVVVVVVVVVSGVGGGPALVSPLGPQVQGTASPSPVPRESGPVPLRDGVPDLPADEVARLEALHAPGPLPMPSPPGPFGAITQPEDCGRIEMDLEVHPAELDGLDASGMSQVCAVTENVGGALGTNGVLTQLETVYRFYLPPGVDLDAIDSMSATDAGVSWTEVLVNEPTDPIAPDDRPTAEIGGTTTVRWGAWDPALASVRRTGPSSTEISWVEPYARSTSDGYSALAVRATVAAAPVRAVRAALGFTNQGGKQVLHSDDGTLLLVPSSPPQDVMQALNGGVLTRTEEGCLGLHDDAGGFQLVLWPYGSTWDSATQTLSVPATEGSGRQGKTFRLGEDVLIGGGEAGSMAPLGLLPAACATEKTWIAGIS